MDLSGFTSRIADLLADGSSPKATATLRYIQAILNGEVVIPGGIAMLMKELACDGHVNPEIDDTHFPGADPFVSTEGVVEVDVPIDGWNDAEAAAYLDAMVPPMEPVMPNKGIKYAAKNPDAQGKHPLVISGQKCRASGERVCVIVLYKDSRGRNASLSSVHGPFSRYCRILAEPKNVAAGT